MSKSTLKDTKFLMYHQDDDWNNSVESILTQKITKLTKSDSLFQFPTKFNPNLTFSELELKEANLRNLKSKQPKWEVAQEKSRFGAEALQTKNLQRDELEILKINLSAQDKISTLRESQEFWKESKKKGKRNKRLVKTVKRPSILLQKCSNKVRDLVLEIDGSETAKTDTIIWKFLKRGPSFRREYVNARTLFIELQALHFPGLGSLSNSRFQNTQPVKVTCPNCGFFITTRIKRISSVRTKLTSFVMATIGLCFIPHLIYAFKDTVHLCPLCKIYLGFCPAFGLRSGRRALNLFKRVQRQKYQKQRFITGNEKMVSASSTSAKNLFVESKLRLSDRVQVNVNNIAAITRQIQRGSKANENLITAAKNFALQEAAIENSETNLKKLKLLSTHINNQLDSLQNSSSKMEMVLEQVRSMQR